MNTYVDSLVRPEVSALSELLGADGALEGLLPGVPAHMNLQGARTHEALGAFDALEGPLSSVSPHVVAQMPVRRERSSAVRIGTQEGLLTVMNALVRLQVAFLSEALAAAWVVALKWLFSFLHITCKIRKVPRLSKASYMGALVDLESAGA